MQEIKMPQLGLTMEEGTIGKWAVKEGDIVKKGDILLEITTDKITTEMESEFDGKILKITAKEGEDVPVQGLIAYIGDENEQVKKEEILQEKTDLKASNISQKNNDNSAIVIGGGPGGYVAAIRLAQLGAEVTLIEKEKLGGTCLNVGCIPTKVLLHYSELIHSLKEAKEFGVKFDKENLAWDKVQDKKSEISNRLVKGVETLMKSNGIKVIYGQAHFSNEKEITVVETSGDKQVLTADKIIIATGSIPAIPPIKGLRESKNCIDSTDMLSLEKIPSTLLIIGGGVIGVEMASVYNSFGTKVTIIEALPQILPLMDEELAGILRKNLENEKIEIFTNAKVLQVADKNNKVEIQVENNGQILNFEADKVLVSVGRKVNTNMLKLDEVGIKNERGKVTVNSRMETNVEGVYAIGDCLGEVMLAHVASAQGEVAAENAMGEDKIFDIKTNPSCIYTSPEFAGAGLTEKQAKEKGIEYEVGKFPLMANGKALITNGGNGVIKVLVGKEYKEILGVHILGPRATDLIGEGALAIGMEATVEDIIDTIHAHPTLTEAFRESVLDSQKIAVHIPRRK